MNPATNTLQGFHLVVGNVDEGGTQFLVQFCQLGPHLGTQLGIQVGQRFVKQEHLGLTDDSTAQRNTLPLTTGQSLGLAVQQVGDIQDSGGLFHAALDFLFGSLAQLQAESHIVIYRHMGIQSVALEHHGDVSVFGGHFVHQLVADVELALGDFFQTGDHTQRGRFTTSGRTNQDDKLLVFDFQREIRYSGNAARISLINIA